jgi:phosphatidylserine decarboxylase
VYQAFLSADSYHRFHAPVSGQIVDKPNIVAGTYYSEPLLTGFSPDSGDPNPDAGADEATQGYISAVATRGVMFIQADNPDIGLVCMIMVGMAEVSSVDITMQPNKPFKKGDQLGMFHFGGSAHCLCFRPGVNLKFNFPDNIPDPNNTIQWPVNSALATVTATSTVA